MQPTQPPNLWLSTAAYDSFKLELYEYAFANGRDADEARYFVHQTIKALYVVLPRFGGATHRQRA